MTAAATPRGRPQYAASRDEIAPSASGGRNTFDSPQTAIVDRASRRQRNFAKKSPTLVCRAAPRAARGAATRALHRSAVSLLAALPSKKVRPHSFLRALPPREADGRRPPPAARRNVRSAHLRCRWRRPKNCSATTQLHPTSIDRAPGEILPFQLIVETGYFPFKAWRAGAAQHSNQACRLQPALSARWPYLGRPTRKTAPPNSHCPRAFFHTAVSKRRAGRTPPPREARNSRYARCGRSRAPGPKKNGLWPRASEILFKRVPCV